jgi:hypothetical protein
MGYKGNQGSSITTLMIDAVQSSETLVNLYQSTQCYNPEDSNLQWINYYFTCLHSLLPEFQAK